MSKCGVSELVPYVSEPYCLCVGAGCTGQFVGTWKTLLGKLLGRRFVSMWLSEHKPYPDIAPFAKEDYFSEFFTEEGNLELGEFLLSDDNASPPGAHTASVIAWQERLFSRQVADIIRQSVGETLTRTCSKDDCKKRKTCPMRREHSLGEVYKVYLGSKGFVASGKRKGVKCPFIDQYATTMAVVELCASGRTRHVINYNFDTVIEETLFQAISSGVAKSPFNEIHIWTYGDSKRPRQIDKKSNRCKIVFHQGLWDDDSKSLHASNAIHVFHVHGVASDLSLKDASGQLIFSQHSYRVYQEAPLNWSNQVLQYLFSKYKVIGVGFSGTDENFRFFAAGHARSSMEGLSAYTRKRGASIVFLRAKCSYRDAINGRIKKANKGMPKRLRKKYTNEFLKYCTKMIDFYYRDYFDVDTVWRNEYLDVAKTLHKMSRLKGPTKT